MSLIIIPMTLDRVDDNGKGLAASLVGSVLRHRGEEAYFVGGCVRDMIMGNVPHDYDICTSATPDKVQEIWKDDAIPTGVRYGTVTVLSVGGGKKIPIEVTTFRGESGYEDGRHPDKVTFSATLEEDLKRRDFTVNAMAFDPVTDRVLSLNELSLNDLRLKTIRCVGDPDERFAEDALRMLRAIRFCATLGFHLEVGTMRAIARNAHLIRKISEERIRDEMTKILCSERPETLRLAQALGLTQYFLPEFDAVVNCPQNNKWHRMGVADHTFEVVRGVDRNNKALRWAAFLHDFGKPVVHTVDSHGHDHFYGHPGASAELAANICGRLKFDGASTDKIVHLCKTHDVMPSDLVGDSACRRAIAKIGVDLFPEWSSLRSADIMAHSQQSFVASFDVLSRAQRIYLGIKNNSATLTVKDLCINGTDVCKALSIEPGPTVGAALKYLLDVVLDDPSMNDRERLLDALARWKR